jgi:hypothetical protein
MVDFEACQLGLRRFEKLTFIGFSGVDFLLLSLCNPENMSNALSNLSVKQLKKAIKLREKIEVLQSKLDQLLGATESLPTAKGKPGRKPKRKMSAASRAKIAAAAKKRWAKVKAAGKSRL